MAGYDLMPLLREEEWYQILENDISTLRFGVYGVDGGEYVPSTQKAWAVIKDPEVDVDSLPDERPGEWILLKYDEVVPALQMRGYSKYDEVKH